MRGETLEVWGADGKVLDVAVCTDGACFVQSVAASATDVYVFTYAAPPTTVEQQIKVRRWPLSGAPESTLYSATGVQGGNLSVAGNGDLVWLEFPSTGFGTGVVRRLSPGGVATEIVDDVSSFAAARRATTLAVLKRGGDVVTPAPSLWTFDLATGVETRVTQDRNYADGLQVANDGSAVMYRDGLTGAIIVHPTTGAKETRLPGYVGCFAGNTPITSERIGENETAIYRGAGRQVVTSIGVGPVCRADGAIALLAPARTSVPVTSDPNVMFCSVGEPEGDLTVVRADGTTTRLGAGYHRLFQL